MTTTTNKRMLELRERMLNIIAEWANAEAISFAATEKLGNMLEGLFDDDASEKDGDARPMITPSEQESMKRATYDLDTELAGLKNE